ncbi:seminase-like [Eurosta solidaginis]|uniref:seminase-like n=1 Tax=Eurosta solidaginis TaxID=178769 RepID=UPI003531157E
MNSRTHIVLLLVLLSCLLTNTNAHDRIVNGTPSNITVSPYMVSLRNLGTYFCSGGLVTLKLVITAAHCLTVFRVEHVSVVAGVTSLQETGQRRRVHTLYYSKSFNSTSRTMDIGAIKVRRAFIAGPTVTTIPLCRRKLKLGTKVRVSGWGVTYENSTDYVDILRTAVMPIVRRQFCAYHYKTVSIILSPSMICAGRGGIDACIGDSGAPGVVNGQLCGVVSFGKGCARANFPGVYTNINNAKVRRFIRNVMNR